METYNETIRLVLVSRAIALGMALVTTLFITASVGTLFSDTQSLGTTLGQIATLPLRIFLG